LPLNLNRLGASRAVALTIPRDIFSSLPKKPWSSLRLEQGEVLKGWHDRRQQRDIVIKQNTGGGKTAIGLLVAQSSINEGVGPAAYLAPDTYLAAQVTREAKKLGIAVTEDPRDHKFTSSEAILVTTFHRLVNGRSVFGVSGTGRAIIPVGTVVVDDAHSALAIAEGQFKILVPQGHSAYTSLLALFADPLKHQSPSAWARLQDGEPAGPVRVPFWSWSSSQDQVLAILRPYGDDDNEKWIYFAWPLLQQTLHLAVATVTSREIEIKSPCPPIDLIPSFAQAKRRVYLTATLADDGVLVTELGAKPSDLAEPVTPDRAADLGDRLILAPLAINPTVDESRVRRLVRDFAGGDRTGTGTPISKPINAIVLVPSDRAAERWNGYSDTVCHVHDLHTVVERLKSGEHLGVVVLVNKYDGVDLPGDACRLLVIDGVPTPLDPAESRESVALSGSETYLSRRVQRIKQGMGRGIRDAEDHCAVLLMGSDLAMTLTAPKARAMYSPASRAQIDLSREVAAQIEGEGLKAVREALSVFLDRDPDWLAASSRAIAGVEYDRSGHVNETAVARRTAFDLARAGQAQSASQTLIDGLRTAAPLEAAWYSEEAATYAHLADPDRAQAILRDARLKNSAVLLPIEAEPVRRLRAREQQAVASSAFLAETYDSGVALVLGITTLLDAIAFDPERTEQAEHAFESLGAHLGFTSERPDKVYGTGPGVLWAITSSQHAVIELKTGIDREDKRIIKSETDQLSGHLSWYARHYGTEVAALPALVHPEMTHHQIASPPPGTLILTPDGVRQLKTAVKMWAVAISQDDGWKQPEVVKQHLTSAKLVGRQALDTFAVRPVATGA
jgi:hypothetical protein